MHDPHLFAVITCRRPRGERQSLGLRNRQCIHVGAQSYNRSRFCTLQNADNACSAHSGLDIQTQTLQVLCDKSRRALLLVSKFRVLVNVPTPIDQLLFDSRRAFANLRFQ